MSDLKPLTDMGHLETLAVLKAANEAEAKLGELKGIVKSIPNELMIINTLSLQEARASSEVENIVTTHDELFRSFVDDKVNVATKEVRAHANSLRSGFERLRQNQYISLNCIKKIQEPLLKNNQGLRKVTVYLKDGHGNTVYTPPEAQYLDNLMDNLVKFINNNDMSPLNPLVKMAVIHHQFESIHPFCDGNGRTGRIINLLYLVLQNRLNLPVLYLSRFIIENKSEYYRLLQSVHDTGVWEEWLLFMLTGIKETAIQSIELINRTRDLAQKFKVNIRKDFPKIYSQDLINSLFEHPYTKVNFVQERLGCSRPTATEKLNQLASAHYLKKVKRGRSNYYINEQLVDILMYQPHQNHLNM